jgi:hypothetical protein
MFYRVRDVNLRPIDPRFFQGAIQNLARWADKWLSCDILLIARLFAEEH